MQIEAGDGIWNLCGHAAENEAKYEGQKKKDSPRRGQNPSETPLKRMRVEELSEQKSNRSSWAKDGCVARLEDVLLRDLVLFARLGGMAIFIPPSAHSGASERSEPYLHFSAHHFPSPGPDTTAPKTYQNGPNAPLIPYLRLPEPPKHLNPSLPLLPYPRFFFFFPSSTAPSIS